MLLDSLYRSIFSPKPFTQILVHFLVMFVIYLFFGHFGHFEAFLVILVILVICLALIDSKFQSCFLG